jgi:hypothetical protein
MNRKDQKEAERRARLIGMIPELIRQDRCGGSTSAVFLRNSVVVHTQCDFDDSDRSRRAIIASSLMRECDGLVILSPLRPKPLPRENAQFIELYRLKSDIDTYRTRTVVAPGTGASGSDETDVSQVVFFVRDRSGNWNAASMEAVDVRRAT